MDRRARSHQLERRRGSDDGRKPGRRTTRAERRGFVRDQAEQQRADAARLREEAELAAWDEQVRQQRTAAVLAQDGVVMQVDFSPAALAARRDTAVRQRRPGWSTVTDIPAKGVETSGLSGEDLARALLRNKLEQHTRRPHTVNISRFDAYTGLGKATNPQRLFDAFGWGRSIDAVHARVLEQFSAIDSISDPREVTARAILVEIGEGILLDRMEGKADGTLVLSDTTREVCKAVVPQGEVEHVSAPDGFIIDRYGRIAAGVKYLDSPSPADIEQNIDDFETYVEHLGDLCRDDLGMIIVTTAVSTRNFPIIPGVRYKTLPITSNELSTYAGIMFRQHQAVPDDSDSTLARAWERQETMPLPFAVAA